MKTRMKKLISIKSVPLFALALLIVLGTAIADSEGDSVTGSGSVTATSEGTFVGPVTLSIEGEKFEGLVTVIPAGGMSQRPDGGWDFPGVIHQFIFEEGGGFNTLGDEIAKPTGQPGLYILDGYMNVTGGTGAFLGASGEMNVHGQIHLVEGWASFKINGTISR
jgi:hypothetical protein